MRFNLFRISWDFRVRMQQTCKNKAFQVWIVFVALYFVVDQQIAEIMLLHWNLSNVDLKYSIETIDFD